MGKGVVEDAQLGVLGRVVAFPLNADDILGTGREGDEAIHFRAQGDEVAWAGHRGQGGQVASLLAGREPL